tara:strand:- start:54 stop:308 length:255 start_codon:yes stop_codon:yes gene_type:complete
MTHSENLNRQLRIGDVLNVIMAQSLKLMNIINANQKEVNRLKKELDQLKTHTNNATDKMDNDGSIADEIDDGDKYRDADMVIHN